MLRKSRFLKVLSLFFCLVCSAVTGWGQSSTSLFWEPEFEVKVGTETNWFYSFGAANRTRYFEKVEGEKVAGQNQEHFELTHFTGYRLDKSSRVSFGVRYRFIEAFNDGNHDELRLTQQYNFAAPDAFMDMEHRFRFEQRFKEQTEYRLRYEIGIAQSLSEVFEVGLATETLYAMGPRMSPELEQRISVGISNTSFENLEISLGFEYQYEDYLHVPQSELFILSGLTLKL